MNSLYDVLIALSESHCRFKSTSKSKRGYADLLTFDLDNKTIRNGGVVIMENGKVTMDTIELTNGETYDIKDLKLLDESLKDNPYEIIESLYKDYKYSLPSAHSQFSRNKFKCLRADELTLEQLINGRPRIKTQYKLEAYILLASVLGWVPWENCKHFYWSSENDRDLILYKDWVVKGE